jgi:integrase
MAKQRKDNKGRVLRKGEVQRKDGRYLYNYTDPLGRRKFIYSKSIVELRRREEELVRDQLDGLDTYVAQAASINYVFDRYISTKTDLRETTRTNYTYMYNHFVRETFGKKKIGDVKYSDVLAFYQYLIKEEEMQINTLDTIHSVLHPTFQMAVRDNIIRSNPSDGVMKKLKKLPGKNHGVRHALTPEQQRAFIKYIEEEPEFYHWMPLFKFLLGTGCRVGEAIGIRWEDIDFDKRIISINHSLVYYSRTYKDHACCSFGVSLPKTEAGIRTIPMLDSVYEALKLELEDQQEYGFNKTVIDGMTGFVFMNRFGNVQNPEGINRAIRRICENYNAREEVNAARENRKPLLLPHFSCHHLRHTFCSRLCENETNLKVIQSVMGHASIETTMDVYAEVTDAKKAEELMALSKKWDMF